MTDFDFLKWSAQLQSKDFNWFGDVRKLVDKYCWLLQYLAMVQPCEGCDHLCLNDISLKALIAIAWSTGGQILAPPINMTEVLHKVPSHYPSPLISLLSFIVGPSNCESSCSCIFWPPIFFWCPIPYFKSIGLESHSVATVAPNFWNIINATLCNKQTIILKNPCLLWPCWSKVNIRVWPLWKT